MKKFICTFLVFAGLGLSACNESTPLGHVPDCAGVPGGDAEVDECGLCNGDNSTCSDCHDVPNGRAELDECGVCGGDDSTCLDCAGTPNGPATLDDCGVCSGDNTTCADCAGVPNGTATADECGVCDVNPENDNETCLDCAGVPNGTAIIDDCGICAGDNSTCLDCAGIPNGTAELDLCGVCAGDDSTCLDCTGIPNGTSIYDECGICNGDNGTCLDCAGAPNGDAVIDQCGVCEGDGSSCPILELEPVADATVNSTATSTNYGADQELKVDRSYDETFLRFDLSAIPAGATIEVVRLEMTAYHGFAWGSDGNVYTYLVTDDTWEEMEITWNTKPSSDATALGYWWLWYDYTDYTVRIGELMNEDLLEAVRTEQSGDAMISFRLHSPGYRTNYRSREYADEMARPKLEIAYKDCNGEIGGEAFVDSCEECVGGETGLEACVPEPEPEEPEEPSNPTVDPTSPTALNQQGSCGGANVTVSCPEGRVAVGYSGKSGYWFDHMHLICATLEADGTVGTDYSYTSQVGQSNGGDEQGDHLCPENMMMVGAQVRVGDHLDRVQGRCMSVASVLNQTANTSYEGSAPAMGGNGGSDYGNALCPAGHVVTGVMGSNAQYLCRVTWQCSPVTSE